MQEENPNSSEYLEIIRMVDAFRYSSEYSLRGAVDNLAEIIVLLTAGESGIIPGERLLTSHTMWAKMLFTLSRIDYLYQMMRLSFLDAYDIKPLADDVTIHDGVPLPSWDDACRQTREVFGNVDFLHDKVSTGVQKILGFHQLISDTDEINIIITQFGMNITTMTVSYWRDLDYSATGISSLCSYLNGLSFGVACTDDVDFSLTRPEFSDSGLHDARDVEIMLTDPINPFVHYRKNS